MSCLRLRLPPAGKAWKSFTSKIQTKLHKLNKHKTIKKSRYPLKTTDYKSYTTYSSSFEPYKSIQLRHKRRRVRVTRAWKFLKVLHKHPYKPAPVYVDKLFKEPAVLNSKHNVQTDISRSMTKEKSIVEAAETSNGNGIRSGNERSGPTADDMWESLALASPQLHGIDQRAEEFIARFRADMEDQERLARHL